MNKRDEFKDKYIGSALKNKDYEYIFDHFNELLLYVNKDYSELYDYLFPVLFKLKKFKEINKLYESLLDNDIESNISVTYALLSVLNTDLYKALSIINNSNVLNGDLKIYHEEGGANYINLLKENDDVQLAFIICNFIKELARCTFDKEQVVVKYYELISLLYELGYNESFINKMNEIGYIIFN